jgi:lipid II:glycine glycyltransferase (peptidoglycan interpeptide bridge formation enzyme)
MKVFEIKEKDRLDDYVASYERDSFLQSWDWGVFQESSGNKIYRFALEDEGKITAAASFYKIKAPFGLSYFYCPRGPILETGVGAVMPLFNKIAEIAKKEKAVFFRFEPWRPIMNYDFKEVKIGDWTVIKTKDVQPSETIFLDLNKSEEELLKEMHQKTRYNIRLAEKKGVKIVEVKNSPLERGVQPLAGRGVSGSEYYETFWNLMEKTSGRDGFTAHAKDYYQKLLQTDPDIFKLFVAEFDGKIIAAGVFGFFGDTATYLFGASSDEDRNVMAPYLLQWEMIKKAKKENFKYYDFFGISEKKWPGVTRFKRGFGGQEIKYPGAYDVVFSKINYKAYQVLRKAHRLFR